MSKWTVHGGRKLAGSTVLPGSSTVTLFLLAASLLTGCEAELTNCPDVRKIREVLSFLTRLGCRVQRAEDVVSVDTHTLWTSDAPVECLPCPELFRTALAVRRGEPQGGGIVCLEESDPADTACAVLAACGAEVRTILLRASKEPEIAELQQFLRLLGVNVAGAGSDRIIVDGFSPVSRVGYRVCPERMIAATVACACACAGGDVEIRGISPETLCPVTDVLTGMGCETGRKGYTLRLHSRGVLNGGGTVIAGRYPKVTREFVPSLMAAALKAKGRTVFVDRNGGFPGADAMACLGGNVDIMGSVAVVNGTERLRGASLRAESEKDEIALTVAALSAEGTSEIASRCPETGKMDEMCDVLAFLGATIQKSEYEVIL